MSARPRPKRIRVATSDAWRGPTGQLRLFGAPPPLIFLEAKASWLWSAKLGRRCVARMRALAPSAPAIAGEGDHWSSRSERTVVEGALDSKLRCRCRSSLRMKSERAKMLDITKTLAARCSPAPPPPPLRGGPPPRYRGGGWQRRRPRPSPAIAGADKIAPMISPLLTDLYQLNMAQAYLDHGDTDTAVFEFFARTLPARRGFLLAAGLEQALDFLENLRFSADEIAWLKSTGRFKQNLLDYLRELPFQRRRARHARRHGVLRQRADPAHHRAVAAGAIRRIAADQHFAFSVAGRRQGGAHAARRAGQSAGRFRAAPGPWRRGRTDGGAGELSSPVSPAPPR